VDDLGWKIELIWKGERGWERNREERQIECAVHFMKDAYIS